MRVNLLVLAGFAALSLAACISRPPPDAHVEQVAIGMGIAMQRCADCHAIGLNDDSPATRAPAFRDIEQRYRIAVLKQQLINGVHIGVAAMPRFDFTPAEGEALEAYLRELQIVPMEPKALDRMAKAEQVATGEEVASRNCGRCHGLGDALVSPRPEAPPLRVLAQRYRTEVLHEELVSGLHFGIVDMPKFALSLAESDALTAYLESLAKAAPRE